MVSAADEEAGGEAEAEESLEDPLMTETLSTAHASARLPSRARPLVDSDRPRGGSTGALDAGFHDCEILRCRESLRRENTRSESNDVELERRGSRL
jgi:hypothetical protein